MTTYLYDFIPFFVGGIVALLLLFRIYKRSVTTFVYIVSQTVVINLIIYGYIDEALIVMLLTMVILLVRAMTKSDNDKFFSKEVNQRKEDLK